MRQCNRVFEMRHVGDAGVVFAIFAAGIDTTLGQAANDRWAECFAQHINAVGAGGDNQGLHADVQHVFEQLQPWLLPKRQPCAERGLAAHLFFPVAVGIKVDVTKNNVGGAGAGGKVFGLSDPDLFVVIPASLSKGNGQAECCGLRLQDAGR